MKLTKIVIAAITALITIGMAGKASADGVRLNSDSVQITNNSSQAKRVTISRIYRVCGITTAKTKRVTLKAGFMQVEPISVGRPARLIIKDDSNGLYISKTMY